MGCGLEVHGSGWSCEAICHCICITALGPENRVSPSSDASNGCVRNVGVGGTAIRIGSGGGGLIKPKASTRTCLCGGG